MPVPRRHQSSGGRRETYAEVVTALVNALDMEVKEFAVEYVYGRTSIFNAKGAVGPTDPVHKRLVADFPEWAERLGDAYAVWQTEKRKPRRSKASPLRTHVEALQGARRFAHAQHAVLDGLRDAETDKERHWLYEMLATVNFDLHRGDEAITALHSALDCALASDLFNEELATRERLAAEYHHERLFDEAHRILDDGLMRFPGTAMLWLRKGRLHWYEGHYSLAYAALMAASKYHYPKQQVLYNSAQVLTEWGSFHAALIDIGQFLSGKVYTQDEGAAVRSARAYIWGQTGQLSRALKEFANIEKALPDVGWVYYRRAICHHGDGNTEAASADLLSALTSKAGGLTPGQHSRACELLREYKVLLPSEPSLAPYERRSNYINL
jgi:tetratricopeptide (TPR) repeat protein